jgi:cell division protein FtsN
MRTAVVILIMAGLGYFFLAQKRQEQETASAKPSVTQSTSPRPVSEHDWAKHALDRTREVTQQVRQTRKEDGVRK